MLTFPAHTHFKTLFQLNVPSLSEQADGPSRFGMDIPIQKILQKAHWFPCTVRQKIAANCGLRFHLSGLFVIECHCPHIHYFLSYYDPYSQGCTCYVGEKNVGRQTEGWTGGCILYIGNTHLMDTHKLTSNVGITKRKKLSHLPWMVLSSFWHVGKKPTKIWWGRDDQRCLGLPLPPPRPHFHMDRPRS